MSLSSELEKVKNHVLTETTAKLAPVIFDARANPRPNHAEGFSFDLSVSRNRVDMYRDQDKVRVQHDLVIAFVQPLNMDEQFESLKAALDREEALIAACGPNLGYSPVRLEYLSTRRALTPSREYLVVQVMFRMEHDLTRAVT